MKTEQFRKYWNDNYPDSLPIGYELREKFKERWFRIHSLPESKRYAENEDDYKIILERQNTIISDIFNSNAEFYILIGIFENDLHYSSYLKHIKLFERIDRIDLHETNPIEYEKGMVFQIFLKKESWCNGKINEILRSIADDEIRAILINQSTESLIIPYDGGIDIIVKDSKTRDNLKKKYSEWSSSRVDEL